MTHELTLTADEIKHIRAEMNRIGGARYEWGGVGYSFGTVSGNWSKLGYKQTDAGGEFGLLCNPDNLLGTFGGNGPVQLTVREASCSAG